MNVYQNEDLKHTFKAHQKTTEFLLLVTFLQVKDVRNFNKF